MLASVGAPSAGGLIVKILGPLVPIEVVTVTVRSPSVAVGSITTLAVSAVPLLTATPVTVTPLPPTVTVVAPTTKLVPVNVTATVVPRAPLFGETLASVGVPGGSGTVTVKICAPLVPAAVVTVTFRGPSAAAALTTKLAVSDVVLPATTLLTVTPLPLTATVVAPMTKPAPVSVTATVAPWSPRFGATLASAGAPGGRDREGLRGAGPGGRRDRHRAGTRCCGRIDHEIGGQ